MAKMILRILMVFFVVTCTMAAYRKCPKVCVCKYDEHKRPIVTCKKGGMKLVPVNEMENNIEELIIYGEDNHLTIGPIFQSFQKLEVLRISNSNVPTIGSNSFLGVQSLKVLDLSYNNITSISDDNFRGLDELVYLNLAENSLDRTPSGAFRYLTLLRELDLSTNMIVELVPRIFLYLSKLRKLNLSNNPLEELPSEVFKDVANLHYLSCRNCQLRSVNSQLFTILRSLTYLNLGDNKITYINRNDFNDLRHLKRLSLDGNQLRVVLQYVFEFQRSLVFLDLSRNDLMKITHEAFHNLGNLTELDLSHNNFEKIDEFVFHPLTKLHSLKLDGNSELGKEDLTVIFGRVPDLTSLSVVDMGPFPDEFFEPISKLQFLNISNNSLTSETVGKLLTPLRNLGVLDLSKNNIFEVKEPLAIKLSKIENVLTADNPIICDKCHMGSLIGKIKDLRWENFPECHHPENVRGYTIQNIDIDSIESCLEYSNIDDGVVVSSSSSFMGGESIGAYVIGGLILMAVIIIIMLIIFSRHSARYYTREENRTETEKNPSTAPITNNEINFKFPLDDRVCTIDEICLPPPPPTPNKNLIKRDQ